MLDSLAAYPRWLVVACLTVLLAVAIWVMIKVVKGVLYVLLVLVILGGASTVVWLLLQ